MAPIQNVAIVGAGGNLGAPLTAIITAAGFNVTIISRKSSKSTFPGHKVISVSDDFPEAELVEAFKGQDAILSTITTVATGGQEKLIDAAIKAGVRRFLPSEFGSDTDSEAALNVAPILQNKRKVTDYLKARQDKIEWTAVISGPFFEWGLDKTFIGFNLPAAKATLTDAGAAKFSTSQFSTIGDAVAAALRKPEQSANTFIYVESLLVSQQDILAALEKATGKKFAVEQQDGKKLIADSNALIAAGNHFGEFGLIQATILVEGLGGDFHAKAARDQATYGFKTLDLQTEVDKAVKNILG